MEEINRKINIRNKRLILRDWNKKDIIDLIDGLNNIEISKRLAFVPYPYTKKDAEKRIEFCIESSDKRIKRNSYYFAISKG